MTDASVSGNRAQGLEWAKAFLAEAAKDKAECEYVVANRDKYERIVVVDAKQRLARLNDPDGVVPMVEALTTEIEAKAWALGVIAGTAQFYEKHLKEIVCASDEVLAEDLRAHAGSALEEADWTDEEIAQARAALSKGAS